MVQIKDWFIRKNFTQTEQYIINTGDLIIQKETEKAVYIKAESDFGNYRFWCPKACLMTEADVEAKEEAFNIACDKFEQLKAFAKENGIKVAGRMKKSTLVERMGYDLAIEAMKKGLLSTYDVMQYAC